MRANDGDRPCFPPTAFPIPARSRPRPTITTSCAAPSPISAGIGASSPRSRPSPKPPASHATELHHLFRRWAGLTPKAFLQALTLDHARNLLRDSASVLDATYEVGLSGPGRLHDLFVTHEAMSPGEWKSGGEGLTLRYGFHPSPFGMALVMAHRAGFAGLALRRCRRGARSPGRHAEPLAESEICRGSATHTAPMAQRIFDPATWRPDRPLRVMLIGTDFEVRVWETLLRIPMGRCSTYSDIAARSASRKRRARSAPRSGKIRSASWCRAIA